MQLSPGLKQRFGQDFAQLDALVTSLGAVKDTAQEALETATSSGTPQEIAAAQTAADSAKLAWLKARFSAYVWVFEHGHSAIAAELFASRARWSTILEPALAEVIEARTALHALRPGAYDVRHDFAQAYGSLTSRTAQLLQSLELEGALLNELARGVGGAVWGG